MVMCNTIFLINGGLYIKSLAASCCMKSCSAVIRLDEISCIMQLVSDVTDDFPFSLKIYLQYGAMKYGGRNGGRGEGKERERKGKRRIDRSSIH